MSASPASPPVEIRHGFSFEEGGAEEPHELHGIVGFLAAGIRARERVACLANPFLTGRILVELRSRTLKPEALILRGDLSVQSSREPFLAGNALAGRRVLEFLRDQVRIAVAGGFSGTRFVLEMSWIAGGADGLNELRLLEWMLHEFCRAGQVRVLCHFEPSRFPPDFLLSLLEMHEAVVCGDRVTANPFFTFFPPGEKEGQAAQTLAYRLEILNRFLEEARVDQADAEAGPPRGVATAGGVGLPTPPPAGPGLFPKAIQTLFASNLAAEQVFADLLGEAKALAHSGAGLVALTNPFSGRLLVRAADPLFAEACQPSSEPGGGPAMLRGGALVETLAENVLRHGKGFFTNDLRRHPLIPAQAGLDPGLPLDKVLLVPFYSDREPSGILILAAPEGDYGPADLLRLQEFSQIFGLAVLRKQLQDQMRMLEEIVHRSAPAIAVTDAVGRFLTWTPKLAERLRIEPGGSGTQSLVPLLFPGSEGLPRDLREAVQGMAPWSGRVSLPLPAGESAPTEISLSPLAQEDGGALLIWTFADPAGSPSEQAEQTSDEGPGASGAAVQTFMPDFQKCLATIIGNIEMLQLSFGPGASCHVETLREIRGAVDRVWTLLAQMQNLCRQREP